MKLLEKFLWNDGNSIDYCNICIEDIVEEIQKQHKNDEFYLLIHKFEYVDPEDTRA